MAEYGIHSAAEVERKRGQLSKDLGNDLSDLGMSPTTFDRYIESMVAVWKDKYGFAIIDTIENDLRSILSQSISEGWTATQLQGEIERLYAEYTQGMTPARALRIARTETSRVMNESELAAYKAVGETKKTYCAELDEFACPECADMDGMVIPIDESFPEGDPPVHPSCRCNILGGEWI
jgi:SPP1 gp7 family putative phage head morphogenesis protein